MKKNQYYFSKEDKIFTIIHPEKGLNPLIKKNQFSDFSDIAPAIITGNSIKREFANTHQLLFEVTSVCNLKCKYCAYGELYERFEQRESQRLSFKKAQNLIDYFVSLQKTGIYQSFEKKLSIGFYGGEPLLNFDLIVEIADYVKKQIPHISFTMTTNGVLLHKYMDYLKENDFNLLISLDGNEYNDSYRVFHDGNTSFAKVFENIKLLQQKYPEYFEKKVNFSAVLHNRNSVTEVYNFLKKEFNKVPTLSEINDSGLRDDKKEEFLQKFKNLQKSLRQAEDYEQIVQDMNVGTPEIDRLARFLFRYSGNMFNDYNDLFRVNNVKRKSGIGTCAPFSRKIYLTAIGKVFPCERIGEQFELGEVTDENVEINFEHIAEKYNFFYQKVEKLCARCNRVEVCTKCMFTLSKFMGDPVCESFVKEADYFDTYAAAQLTLLEKKPTLYKYFWENIVFE